MIHLSDNLYIHRSDNLYIHLFHGRDFLDQDMDEWGFDGPMIGPVGISWTYGCPKVHPPGWNDNEELRIREDCVEYLGKFYGDFEIFAPGDEKLTPERITAAHSFETFTQNMNRHEPRIPAT